MHDKDDLHNRIVALESIYKELGIKREEVFFLSAKYEAEMSDIKETVGKIHSAIVGNEPMGHVGIAKTIKEQDKRIKDLETFANNFKVTIAKIGAIGGILGAGITFILERLIKWVS